MRFGHLQMATRAEDAYGECALRAQCYQLQLYSSVLNTGEFFQKCLQNAGLINHEKCKLKYLEQSYTVNANCNNLQHSVTSEDLNSIKITRNYFIPSTEL